MEFHSAALQRLPNHYRVIGVADLDLAKAQSVAARFGAEAGTDGLAMVRRMQPDVTLVALPHLLHLEYGIAALESGSHLLLEKPMAVSSEHCRRLMDCAAANKRCLMVGHTHSFRPHFRKAAQMIREGVIGEVQMILDEGAAYYDFEHRPRWFLDPRMAGGGALFNLVPHQVDHLLSLHAAPITEVTARLSRLYPGVEVDTECAAFLRYADGAVATLSTSVGNRLIEPLRYTCRVFGTKGSLLLTPFKTEVVHCIGSEREVIDCSEGTEAVELEWREFHRHILDGTPIQADGRFGLRVVSILEAIRAASESNRPQPIHLP
jgi:predicted dehydrogenase